MYDEIIEPILLYGCKVWTLKVRERKKMEGSSLDDLFEEYQRS